jgi:hypothetical protein
MLKYRGSFAFIKTIKNDFIINAHHNFKYFILLGYLFQQLLQYCKHYLSSEHYRKRCFTRA